MKTLYLDCSMGAAGDMLTAALLELLPDPDAFVDELNRIGIPHVVFRKSSVQKCGITGTHISVLADGTDEADLMEHPHAHDGHHHHEHSSMEKIETVIDDLPISDNVRADVRAVYSLIAEAESHVHNCPVSEIHFHEVGTLDAIADVTAVCLLMERIAPDSVVASPVHVGSGTVSGILSNAPVLEIMLVVFQSSSGLKVVTLDAFLNRLLIFVTLEVFQPAIASTEVSLDTPWNIDDISNTFETSHCSAPLISTRLWAL